ncbi:MULTISPECIES: tape measure protein [unclassified Gilliamella]|uniref:tape measure protein n=1 Tax=unclassified Gilliamella TaxID=2685620 RepID=UPI00226A20BA|nr:MULTISPECIES: tape measure protein [unclassified Gilliamella]MCX8583452.1 hypothetical protein [Gilliamella sp. B3372]MCX8594064.1 hypothetical protein [Gilliamella sp. B3367]
MAQYTEGNITYTVSLEMKELLENSRKIMQEMKELNNSGSKASKGLEKLESSAQSAGNSLGKLTNIAKAVSAALVSSTVIAYAQSWNELEDRIQNTGATASQTKDILDQLLVTSDRNGRTIEESAELYIRLSNSMGELGYSTQSTISYIGSMSDLFTINKTSAIGAESAINALTKAQMRGKLAGVEAMTVFSNMPSVLGTLTNYLKKNAKSTADAEKITEQYVKQLASDGKLSIQTFTDALIDSNVELDALADNMRNTVTDGINRVTNNLKKYLGELNNSTGATKLLVDSLILMSQHVDILMTGVGALAAIYAGKYITSLASATKQSAEKVIENIRLATSERNLAKEELRTLEVEGKALTARRNELIALKSVTTSKVQLAAIEKQLNNIEKERALLVDKETAAQERLASATKLSTLAANGLKGAMSLLGGPAGLILLTAGALVTWSSKAAEAKQKALELTDEVAALAEKYKGLSKAQREAFAIDLKKRIHEQNKAIEEQDRKITNLKNKIKAGYGKGRNEQERVAILNKQIEAEEKLKAVMIEGRNKLVDLTDEVIIKNHEMADSTNKASKSGKKLIEIWDKASKDNIDKKVASLSKELDIATLKAEDNSEAAFILDGLYSALGDSANEYREDLKLLALGQTEFTKLTKNQAAALQPLVMLLKSLSAENDKIKASSKKGTTKSYADEVKELSEKLEIAKLEAKGMTVEAELLAITQKMGSKVTAEQTAKLKELIETAQAYKELGSLKSPIDVEQDSFKKSKELLDRLHKLGEIKQADYNSKLEQLEQQHQVNMAKIKSEAVVSKVDDAVAQVDPVQALKNENDRKLALIQEFENQKLLTEENAIALREAANRQYEQNRINAQWEIWRNQNDANEFLASSLEGLASSATSTISGLMSGTMTATQAMQNFANVILNEAIGSLVQMGMQYVKNAIVAKTTSAATTATQTTEAIALAAAYKPAAMLASIASYGAAATTGATAYGTAIGLMSAIPIAGARKNGGPVDANSMYRVGEGGKPEILMQGGKQYLIPGDNGKVLSNRQITSNQGQNIQWNFIVENYASGVEVSKPSIDYENKIIRTAVTQAKREVANDIKEHTGEVWQAMSRSTNIQSKL